MNPLQLFTTASMLSDFCSMVGEMPNIPTKTMGGHIWWDTIKEVDGWKIQENKVTGHCRILDDDDIRRAWGSREAILKAYKRFVKECARELVPGDVLAVSRDVGIPNLYEHYAIYAGDGEVIHFASESGDFGGNITVHRAPFSDFLCDSKDFQVLDFEPVRSLPDKSPGKIPIVSGQMLSGAMVGQNAMGWTMKQLANDLDYIEVMKN